MTQEPPENVLIALDFDQAWGFELFSDSDRVLDKRGRRNVSAAIISLQRNMIHSSGRTQRYIALSSAEATLYSSPAL